MGSFSVWIGDGGSRFLGLEPLRAALAWRRINDKKTSIQFRTPANVTLDAQAVRVEYDSGAGTATSEAGAGAVRKAVIFGIKGHATLPDTDIKEGYRCVLGGAEYRCVGTLLTIGELQANFEEVG